MNEFPAFGWLASVIIFTCVIVIPFTQFLSLVSYLLFELLPI